MTRNTRRILFYISVLVFAFFSYIAVLYAQGYKYDFGTGKFIKTGSIFLRSNTDADVFLDDVFVGSNSFLNDSFVIGRLLPGQYYVRLERPGYTSWKKNILVEESLVTEFSKILLLPGSTEDKQGIRAEIGNLFVTPSPVPTPIPTRTPRPSPGATPTPIPFPDGSPVVMDKNTLYYRDNGQAIKIADAVKGFQLSPNSSRVAWWTERELWVFWLSGTSYQPYKIRKDVEYILRSSANIVDARWFRGDDHIVLEFSNGTASTSYQIWEIDKRGGLNSISL